MPGKNPWHCQWILQKLHLEGGESNLHSISSLQREFRLEKVLLLAARLELLPCGYKSNVKPTQLQKKLFTLSYLQKWFTYESCKFLRSGRFMDPHYFIGVLPRLFSESSSLTSWYCSYPRLIDRRLCGNTKFDWTGPKTNYWNILFRIANN